MVLHSYDPGLWIVVYYVYHIFNIYILCLPLHLHLMSTKLQCGDSTWWCCTPMILGCELDIKSSHHHLISSHNPNLGCRDATMEGSVIRVHHCSVFSTMHKCGKSTSYSFFNVISPGFSRPLTLLHLLSTVPQGDNLSISDKMLLWHVQVYSLWQQKSRFLIFL